MDEVVPEPRGPGVVSLSRFPAMASETSFGLEVGLMSSFVKCSTAHCGH